MPSERGFIFFSCAMKEFIVPPPQFVASCGERSKLLNAGRGEEWYWDEQGFSSQQELAR